jgi:hypothetical protein
MVGVWIEPVIAQLMMILLAMARYFPYPILSALSPSAAEKAKPVLPIAARPII